MKRATFAIFFFAKKNKPLKDGTLPLYVRVTINGRSKESSLGISITPALWNAGSQKAIGKSRIAEDINQSLRETESSIRIKKRIIAESEEVMSADSVMKAYKGIEAKRWTLLGLFREHQNRFSELVNKGHFSVRTLERYETSFNHLTEYLAKEYKSTDLDANAIDLRFVTGFEHFLKVSKDCEHNSAMKHMKGLRKIVLHAVHEDIIHKDPFHYYKIREKPVEKDFLNQTEIDLIYNKDIPNKRLVTIRDMFIFQCYTGMAYCDILTLAPEHIVTGDDGRLWIIKPRKKTRNIFRIPLLPRAEEILLRYSSEDRTTQKTLLPVSSNQKMNAYLKELGIICGIEKNLTTHLGRHTFATTVTLNNRITKPVLQKMMGVTKASTIEIYAKMLDSTISEEMESLRKRLN